MEILGKILGTPARVKIMRLFLLNRGKSFTSKEVARRCRVSADSVRKELKLLGSVGFFNKRVLNYSFNPYFIYANEIERLLITSDTIDKGAIVGNFKRTGRLRLFLVSGIFIKNGDTRVDLLIVGDKMKKGRVEEGVRKLEAEIGKELTYALFDTKEFTYRLSMYDKLVRDILDFPHEILWQSKELSTQSLKNPKILV